MGSYHAKLSPSSASRWTTCSASIAAQEGITDAGSDAARLGTTGHQLSAECLEHKFDPQSYLGRVMRFYASAEGRYVGEDWKGLAPPDGAVSITHEVEVTQETIDACCAYINFVNNVVETTGATLYVEQRVPIGHITGEEEAGGTSDTILLTPNVLSAFDLKLGRKKVNAYDVISPARMDVITGEMLPEVLRLNLQLSLYLLGSLEKYGFMGDFTHVKGAIIQPHLHHVSEYSCTVEELLALGEWLKERAEATRSNPVYAPSFESCHFCKAKFDCKARQEVALETALEGFEDIDHAQPRRVAPNELGSIYARIDMVLDFCKDIQTRVYEDLSAGRPVMRNDGLFYKLVAGKKGDREWEDPAEAEAVMKRMRLREDQMYTAKLNGPAKIEKLATAKKAKKGQPEIKPVIGATQWARIASLITQRDGAPSVALETDPRPAIASAVDGFEDVVAPVAEACDDLF